MRFFLLSIFLTFLTGLVGCSTPPSDYACEPGELQVCPCIGGAEGVQACADGREGWAECQCPDEDGVGGSGSGGVGGTGGMGGADTSSGDSGVDVDEAGTGGESGTGGEGERVANPA